MAYIGILLRGINHELAIISSAPPPLHRFIFLTLPIFYYVDERLHKSQQLFVKGYKFWTETFKDWTFPPFSSAR